MNNNQRITIRAMLLISVGLVLFADVMGVIEEGVMILLSFIGIFSILYGLSMIGVLDYVASIFRQVFSYVKGFLHKIFSFRRKKKLSKSISKGKDMPTIKLTGHRKKQTETRTSSKATSAKKKVALKNKKVQTLKTEKPAVEKSSAKPKAAKKKVAVKAKSEVKPRKAAKASSKK